MMKKTKAIMLLAPGCAHCPKVLESLCRLVKSGQLAGLEVINIAEQPEVAEQLGTRSVPWTRIGPFELEGLHSPKELAAWTTHANQGTGMAEYLSDLLVTGKLPKAIDLIETQPTYLADLLSLIASLDTPMAVRIGIGAILEEYQGSETLSAQIPTLAELTLAAEPQIRADACHYLGLTGSTEARTFITSLLQDTDAEVREIASESLELIGSN